MQFKKKKSLFKILVSISFLLSFSALADNEVKPITSKNAYEILGIPRNRPNEKISDKEVQKAYRKLAMKYHPDRFEKSSLQQQQIARENFKIVSTCYDAIVTGNYRLLIDGITFGEKGSHKQPINPSFGESESSDQAGKNFSDWFKGFDPFWAEQARSRQSANQSKDVTFFEDRFFKMSKYGPIHIYAIYENHTGAIVQTNDEKLYWIPTGEMLVHPIYMTASGSSINIDNFQIRILDTRLPGGQIPLVVEAGRTIKVGDLTFNRTHLLDTDNFNKELAKRDFRLSESMNDIELNLWNYYVFREGTTYTIITMNTFKTYTLYNKDTKVRMFVGNELQMEEIEVKYNTEQRVVEVPSRGLTLRFRDSQDKRPIFDKATGLYMGDINVSPASLDVYNSSSNRNSRELVHEIQPLPVAELNGFSVARLLGDLMELPMTIRTPMDSHFRSQPQGHKSIETSLFGPGKRRRGDSKGNGNSIVASPQSNEQRSQSFDAISNFERNRKAKLEHPQLAKFLDFPKGNAQRLLAEAFIFESSPMDQVKKVIDSTLPSEDRAFAILTIFDYSKTWEEQEKNLFLLEAVVRDHIRDPGIMAVLAMDHIPRIKDYLEHPRVRQIVLFILKSGLHSAIHYLRQRVFGSESAMRDWENRKALFDAQRLAISHQSSAVLKSRMCRDLFLKAK